MKLLLYITQSFVFFLTVVVDPVTIIYSIEYHLFDKRHLHWIIPCSAPEKKKKKKEEEVRLSSNLLVHIPVSW